MAVVTNFKERLTDIAGVLTTADDSALEQWVLDGCYDVIARVGSSPGIIERFLKKTTLGTSEVSLPLDEIRTVVGVEREGYPARRIPASRRKDITLAGSMYYVEEDADPVWYIHDGTLYVKPTVDGGGAFYEYIPEYAITQFDGTSSIADFPPDFYLHILTYAGIKVLERELLDAKNNLPDEVSLGALPELPTPPTPPDTVATNEVLPEFPEFHAPTLSVDMGPVKPGALYWLETEEDTELVSSALSLISKEMEIYAKEWEKANKAYDVAKNEYDKDVEMILKNAEWREAQTGRDVKAFTDNLSLYGNQLTAYSNEITRYREDLAGQTKRFEQEFQIAKTKYEWTMSQITLLKKTYEDLFSPGQQQGGQ